MYLIGHCSKHTSTSMIYCKIHFESIIKLCYFTYIWGLHPDPETLDVGEKILLPNLSKPCLIVCDPGNRLFPFLYKIYMVINRRELCWYSLRAGPYYLADILANCEETDNEYFETSFTHNYIWTSIWPLWTFPWSVTLDSRSVITQTKRCHTYWQYYDDSPLIQYYYKWKAQYIHPSEQH